MSSSHFQTERLTVPLAFRQLTRIFTVNECSRANRQKQKYNLFGCQGAMISTRLLSAATL